MNCLIVIAPPKVRLTPQRGEGVATVSRGVPAEAMPSVVKVLAEVPPRALREVDRLSRNPETAGKRGRHRRL